MILELWESEDSLRKIYDRYCQTVENYIDNYTLKKLGQQCRSLEFLSNLRDSWKKYLIMIKWLKQIFSLVDRYLVPKSNLVSLQDLGFQKFRLKVIEPIKSQIVDTFFKILIDKREGEDFERELLKNIYVMLHHLDSKTLIFSNICSIIESKIVEDIYVFYPEMKFICHSEENLLEYLKKVKVYYKMDKIKHDRFGIKHIIGEESPNSLIFKFLENFINENLNQLLEKDKGMIYLL